MKMAVFSKENAFCVNHFSISYLKIDHWSILRKAMNNYGDFCLISVWFLSQNRSLIDFEKGIKQNQAECEGEQLWEHVAGRE